MSISLSPNTQAILLLTAPLIVGAGRTKDDYLTPSEYKRLAQFLRNKRWQPADLLAPNARELLGECQQIINSDRLERLLARGFQLSQAIERWQTRAIWVVSRADAEYPKRWKERLKEDAPPVLYGCGEAAILETGGLAVVGSRQVDEASIAYTEEIGRLAARASCTVVSGGARGIDQAVMRGALGADGKVAGILADGLERAALNREHRDFLMDGKLVLVSTYDPAAGFNVGHAMQRNKLIYALANAALVVSSDHEKGGTWAGAVEQLEKFRFVPLYVRLNGQAGEGGQALRRKGALPWPDPETPEALATLLEGEESPRNIAFGENDPFSSVHEETDQVYEIQQMSLPLNGASPNTSEADYSAIPADLRDIYRALENEVVWIHSRWIMFRQLFGTNELRIKLLNDTAPSFFGELQSLWMEYIVLAICRITEKPKIAKHDTLVIRQLHERLDKNQYQSLAAQLDLLLQDVDKTTERLRNRRNRKIAHLNQATMLGTHQEPLPGISRQDVEDALEVIRQFLNAIRLEFLGSVMRFEDFIMQDDAETLIFNLRRAAEYRALEKKDHEYRDRVRIGAFHDA